VPTADSIYTDIILEHYKNPNHYGELQYAEFEQRGYNESCGDDINIYLNSKDGKITELQFIGKGCAISQSSASMMIPMLLGLTFEEAIERIEQFKKMITGETPFPDDETFIEISALKGLVKYPVRVKCATLAWNTVRKAIRMADLKYKSTLQQG